MIRPSREKGKRLREVLAVEKRPHNTA